MSIRHGSRQNVYSFHTFAKLVKLKFNIVASLVPCESLFSKTSIRNERATRLSDNHVQEYLKK